MSDVPSFTQFDPNIIPWQYRVIQHIKKFDYSKGILEILLSGSVGSAKSLLATHCLIRHIVEHSESRALVGRKVLGDLKATVLDTINDHIEGDFIEGQDYELNRSTYTYKFWNGSEIISRTWHDKKFKKFRSLKLSFAFFEELTENEVEHWGFYDAIKQRIGRLPHVPQNVMISATNPDSPSHPAYKHFVQGEKENDKIKVFYSLTEQNPFIPDWYIENLKRDLSQKEAERMLFGRWVSTDGDRIYSSYLTERNFRGDEYIFNLRYPIDLMFDFNIGEGKPMSAAVGQYINDTFHIARAFLLDGANTWDMMEEIAASGILDRTTTFRVFGDATGKHRDTRSIHSDYDIIKRFLSGYRAGLDFQMCVARSNPPIRTRHNKVNSYCKNYAGEVRLFVYKGAKEADEGMMLTKLKKSQQYIEDDTLRQQHVTTAIGYWIFFVATYIMGRKSKSFQL